MIGIQEYSSGVAKRLSIDLERGDVSETGFWWCRKCHRITELDSPAEGGAADRCTHCGSKKVEWKPPVGEGRAPTSPALPELPEVRLTGRERREVDEEFGEERKRRLPPERRDLRVLARTGYYFCYGCREITELSGRACALCGAQEVEWQEPALPPENGGER